MIQSLLDVLIGLVVLASLGYVSYGLVLGLRRRQVRSPDAARKAIAEIRQELAQAVVRPTPEEIERARGARALAELQALRKRLTAFGGALLAVAVRYGAMILFGMLVLFLFGCATARYRPVPGWPEADAACQAEVRAQGIRRVSGAAAVWWAIPIVGPTYAIAQEAQDLQAWAAAMEPCLTRHGFPPGTPRVERVLTTPPGTIPPGYAADVRTCERACAAVGETMRAIQVGECLTGRGWSPANRAHISPTP